MKFVFVFVSKHIFRNINLYQCDEYFITIRTEDKSGLRPLHTASLPKLSSIFSANARFFSTVFANFLITLAELLPKNLESFSS